MLLFDQVTDDLVVEELNRLPLSGGNNVSTECSTQSKFAICSVFEGGGLKITSISSA